MSPGVAVHACKINHITTLMGQEPCKGSYKATANIFYNLASKVAFVPFV